MPSPYLTKPLRDLPTACRDMAQARRRSEPWCQKCDLDDLCRKLGGCQAEAASRAGLNGHPANPVAKDLFQVVGK